MLHLPAGTSNKAVIVGIDPGSTCLGLAVMEVSLVTNEILSTTAKTFNASKYIDKHCDITILHGERFSRIQTHKENILAALLACNATIISVESPFFNSLMPNAYGALVEVLVAIKEAVFEYDKTKVIRLMDPPNVKRSVGAKGNAKKEEMKERVLALPDINYFGTVEMEDLDEHSLDAIAVAYGCYKELMKE